MTFTPTRVLQYNEYYPFGMQTAESWTRDNSKNNFLYNGGAEVNTTSGWYDTFFRGYDPALGRFLQVDPKAISDHTFSPYNYVNNNPISFTDPFGDTKVYRDPLNPETWAPNPQFGNPFSDCGGGDGESDQVLGDYSTYSDADLLEAAQSGSQQAIDEYVSRNGQVLYESGNGQTLLGFGPQGVYVANDGSGIVTPDPSQLHSSGISFTTQRGEYVTASEGSTASQGSQSLLESIWNSPMARFIIPDYFQFETGSTVGAIIYGGGTGNITLVLRGRDPGLYKSQTENTGLQIASSSIDVTAALGWGWFATFNPTKVSADVIEGNQASLSAGPEVQIGMGGGWAGGLDVGFNSEGINTFGFKFSGNLGLGVSTPVVGSGTLGNTSNMSPIVKF